MRFLTEEEEKKLSEMATSCHPKKNGGKYPMWIRVEFTNGEHKPPHAHLYSPEQKPSLKTLITKFLITEQPPKKAEDLKEMKGKPQIPAKYAKLIIAWAKDNDEDNLNNWKGLRRDWRSVENSFL